MNDCFSSPVRRDICRQTSLPAPPTQPDIRKQLTPWISGVFLLLLVSGCSPSHPPRSGAHTTSDLPPASVRLESVVVRQSRTTEEILGTITSRHTADIAAKISGRIIELPVALGQTVQQGDLLVVIDSREIQARVDQASAHFRQAEIDFNRIEKLLKTGAATTAEYDGATSRLVAARAAVAEADALLAHSRITAPLTAVVARKNVDLGDLAMPGQFLLRLEDPTHLRLEANIPDSLLEQIRQGETLPVQVEGFPQSLMGTVSELSPIADPATRSSRFRLDLPPTARLRPGLFGRVAVPLADTDRIMIPPAAIVARGQLDMVFVAVEGKARMRIIRTGRVLPEGVEILAGLQAGDLIVTENPAALRDGQPLAPL